jgi:hypothetical protein
VSWPKEVWGAVIGGVATAVGSVITLIGVLATDDEIDHAVRSECIEVLDQIDDFVDKDPRNVQVLLETRADGSYLVDLGNLDGDCGLRARSVLDALSPDGLPDDTSGP